MIFKTNNMRKALCLAVVLTFISCSDEWNDHYEVSVADNGTLWQAISSRQELSNFSRIVKACGYDVVLNGGQTFTVFAPTDEVLSQAEADRLIADYQQQAAAGVRSNDNTVVRQFLQNHMALYKYPVSSLTDRMITLMNNKYAHLTSSTLEGSLFLTSNTLLDNGLLFTLDRQVAYTPNVFECLGHDAELDSVYQFLNSHSVYEFDETKSVAGEIIDGVTHYLDSVSVLRNDLLSTLGLINSEDSTYWFIAPTNSEWNRLVKEYETYFNYPQNVTRRDSMIYTNSRVALIGGGFFSRTVNPDVAFRDSAVSTMAVTVEMRLLTGADRSYYVYQKPFDEGGVFYGTEDVLCSNGHVRKASEYSVSKFDSFVQTIKVEAENVQRQDTIINAVEPLTIREVPSGNDYYGQVSGNSFVEVVPSTPDANVQVSFRLPELLSGMPYNIYGVFAPATAYDPLSVEETHRAYRVRSMIRYPDLNGVETMRRFNRNINVNTEVVDTVQLISNITIPTCSYGLSEPKVKLDLQSGTNGATLRLDCIIVKPVRNEE